MTLSTARPADGAQIPQLGPMLLTGSARAKQPVQIVSYGKEQKKEYKNTDADNARLAKRLRKAETEVHKLEGKLANADFARNAPPEVVAKDHARVAELRMELAQLTAQIARVDALRKDPPPDAPP